jgi:hypothetical protein
MTSGIHVAWSATADAKVAASQRTVDVSVFHLSVHPKVETLHITVQDLLLCLESEFYTLGYEGVNIFLGDPVLVDTFGYRVIPAIIIDEVLVSLTLEDPHRKFLLGTKDSIDFLVDVHLTKNPCYNDVGTKEQAIRCQREACRLFHVTLQPS